MSRAELDSLGMGDAVGRLADDLAQGSGRSGVDPATRLAHRLEVALASAGIDRGDATTLDSMVSHLRVRTPALLSDESPAKRLARRVGRTMPIVYGGGALGAAAASAWKSACNTNAKIPSFASEIVTVGGDEICGWGQHGDVTRQVFSLVLLRHSSESVEEARTFPIVEDICEEIVADVHSVVADGVGVAAQLCDLVVFGEVVSLELAAQAGVDPGPLPILDRFRSV